MKKVTLFFSAFMLTVANAWAVNSGSVLLQNNIRSIVFSGNDMLFRTYDGNQTVHSLDNVKTLVFDISDIPTGINNPVEVSEIIAYVNSAGEVIVESSETLKSLTLLNINGKTLRKTTPSSVSANLNISTLPAGIYILQIKTTKNVTTKKFIKQ